MRNLEDHLQHAKYFPDMTGIPLNSKEAVHTTDLCRDRISVIAMLTTVVSEVPLLFYTTVLH